MSRKTIAVFCFVSILIIVVYILFQRKEVPVIASEVEQQLVKNTPAIEPKVSSVVLFPESKEAVKIGAEGYTIQDDIHFIDQIILAYAVKLGSHPSGDNIDILEKLRGKNEKNFAWFPKDHPSLTSEGALLDRWGTAYFFHSLSSKETEIRSAGPDRKLFTEDDVIRK